MALILSDRVQETASAPGTGTVTLLGAVTGFQPFSTGVGNGNTCYYTIADQAGSNWEVGIGTYSSSGNTLTRTTPLSGSSTTPVNFSSGIQNVFVTYPAEKAVIANNNPGSAGYVLTANGTGVAPTWQQISLNPPIFENITTISSNQVIATGYSGSSVGPMYINPSVSVTIAAGQKWVVF